MKVLKLKTIIAVIGIIASTAFADGLAFKKGTNVIDLGFNFDWSDKAGAKVIWDRGVINNMFSMGADVGYNRRGKPKSVWDLSGWANGPHHTITANYRFAFHVLGIPAIEQKGARVLSIMDPYALLGAGFRMRIYDKGWGHIDWTDIWNDEYDEDRTDGGFNIDFMVGSRFYVKENFHFLVEFGTGMTLGLGWNF